MLPGSTGTFIRDTSRPLSSRNHGWRARQLLRARYVQDYTPPMPNLVVGQIVPEFTVQRRIRQPVSLSELVAQGPAVLHVYIFDFTGSHEGG